VIVVRVRNQHVFDTFLSHYMTRIQRYSWDIKGGSIVIPRVSPQFNRLALADWYDSRIDFGWTPFFHEYCFVVFVKEKGNQVATRRDSLPFFFHVSRGFSQFVTEEREQVP